MEFTEISADRLAELTASKRSGYANETMTEFKNSGIHAADITDQFPGRKLASVANGLKRQAQRAEFSDIKVIYVGGENETLALVNTSVEA